MINGFISAGGFGEREHRPLLLQAHHIYTTSITVRFRNSFDLERFPNMLLRSLGHVQHPMSPFTSIRKRDRSQTPSPSSSKKLRLSKPFIARQNRKVWGRSLRGYRRRSSYSGQKAASAPTLIYESNLPKSPSPSLSEELRISMEPQIGLDSDEANYGDSEAVSSSRSTIPHARALIALYFQGVQSSDESSYDDFEPASSDTEPVSENYTVSSSQRITALCFIINCEVFSGRNLP